MIQQIEERVYQSACSSAITCMGKSEVFGGVSLFSQSDCILDQLTRPKDRLIPVLSEIPAKIPYCLSRFPPKKTSAGCSVTRQVVVTQTDKHKTDLSLDLRGPQKWFTYQDLQNLKRRTSRLPSRMFLLTFGHFGCCETSTCCSRFLGWVTA